MFNHAYEEPNKKLWREMATSKYPTLSEEGIDILRGSAAIQWADQAGDPEIIKLYEQYLVLNRLTQG